jgi:RND family efflux transporter MFP subunit
VKKGDVIAVISAPDTDADLEQAKANLNQQETSYQLAVATEDRYRGLISVQGVTQQQLDQFHSTREQAKANVGATAASVDRLKALVGFEKIIAPFDGVVTTRNYDVGALISATNIAPGQELFDLAEDDKLRVFVNIPQAYALLVKFNQPASLAFERNYPGRLFQGVVARSSGSLDPVTRTLHTEVDFNNDDPDHHIFPGMYGEVVFHIQRDHPVLTVPTSALLFEADGKQVAIVNSSNKIHFQKIVPGRDFGTEIEVIDGLKGDENIVANPSEQLTEGLAVSSQAEKKEDQKQGGQQQGDGKEKDKRQDGKDEH